MAVVLEPFLTDSSVVLAKLEKVAKDWYGARDLGNALNVGYVGRKRPL